VALRRCGFIPRDEEDLKMKDMVKAGAVGLTALLALLAVYFGLLTPVSGWQFTRDEFERYGPYILALAAGFGVQVGLYVYLLRLTRGPGAHGKLVAASGTASAAAMVSCCTHYLANLLPILGASGLVIFVSQYQIEFYWIGLLFSAAGIAFIGTKVAAAYQEHGECLATA
jgi:Cu+-exporting ATPase